MNIERFCRIESTRVFSIAAAGMTAFLLLFAPAKSHAVDTINCPSGNTNYLPDQPLLPPGMPVDMVQPNVKVVGECLVRPGADHEYFYGQINIVENGTLLFREYDENLQYQENTETNFWASAIIIENGGTMDVHAGDDRDRDRFPDPYGQYGGTLNIYLYGKDHAEWSHQDQVFTDQNQGALCASDIGNGKGPCGIPENVWTSNGAQEFNLPGRDDPNDRRDYFYEYGPLRADAMCTNGQVFSVDDGNAMCGSESADGKVGYFGKKAIAVSYGGALVMRGYKGACTEKEIGTRVPGCEGLTDNDPLRSSPGWTRLGADANPNDQSITLDRTFKGAAVNDEIIVTTTDYLPGHSELLKIQSGQDTTSIQLQPLTEPCADKTNSMNTPCFFHKGERFPLDRLNDARDSRGNPRLTIDRDLVNDGAEIRAAVAHITRSIRIISAGDSAGAPFGFDAKGGTENPEYSFGGQLIARQGFRQFQVQGVELVEMGQGGRMGHYAVHFHKARETPRDTYLRDSTINVSMSRWVVIHDTEGVELSRNIGYKSIGHGFYLEDGTETNNDFHSNLGIFARAAVENDQNPRKIPGILADNEGIRPGFPFRSDSQYPSVFWITNGWNDFIGNMAAGAGACGAGFWLPPTGNSDMMDVGHGPMQWSGYAEIQKNQRGISPVKSFYMNYATTVMHSLQTTSDAPVCHGILAKEQAPVNPNFPVLRAVESIAPKEGNPVSGMYFPKIDVGAYRVATVCPRNQSGDYDCSEIVAQNRRCNASDLPISDPNNPLNICAVTVIDHFTSSFHWAEGNVSAIWLRSNWFLLDNSVLTDIQNGGLTFISGGDYTHSSVINGYWTLARNMVFIGHTQIGNGYAGIAGPFNDESGLKCDDLTNPAVVPNYCLNTDEGISMPVNGLFTNQRFANIYDGPSYQDSNAYLDIKKAECEKQGYNGDCMYGTPLATLVVKDADKCWLPNAAIAWKQPNGFYYPPAFHMDNLFFDDVDLRHYVINPLFQAPSAVVGDENFGQGGTYLTDEAMVAHEYCNPPGQLFNNFTAVDRQTELNDDDGSLTGLINSFTTMDSIERQLNQTISVNLELFFEGPVQAPECLSALGTNTLPENACQQNSQQPAPTVTTSPYDYVSTVVYHEPQNPNPPNPSDPHWNAICTFPNCYGVPLYRQYLTGNDGGNEANSTRDWKHWYKNGCHNDSTTPQCRWPFIRMSGSPFFSRQSMTVNNGAYYVDTTVSQNTQNTENFTTDPRPRSINVFQANEKYHMFFVYAKQTTKQTYKFYVGDNFDLDTFKLECVDISTATLEFTEESDRSSAECRSDTRGDWATAKMSDDPEEPGILEVVVDFEGQNDLDPTIANGLCLPRTFCKPERNTCVGALPDNDPIFRANPDMKREVDAVCRKWAVKALDCPSKGCLGFSFVMPAGFNADDSYRRPSPESFPTTASRDDGKPDWTVKFRRTNTGPDSKSGGGCYYAQIPGTDCDVP